MAHFSYTAEKNGEQYHGVAEAVDRFELYQMIRREGGHIVSMQEETSGWLDFSKVNAMLTRISEADKILFARNLGSMISAGLPLARALSVLERQTKNERLKNTISAVAGEVRRGESLHAALAKFPKVFPPLFVAMVRAGEEAGNLPESLNTVSEQMDRMFVLKKKIRGALIYPSIIVVAIVGIGATMMVVVVPTLAATFKEMKAELPASTKVVIAISDFLSSHTILAVIMVLVAGVGIVAGVRTPSGSRLKDWVFLHLPVIGGIVREVNAARTTRTLSSLFSSGVDVLNSLEITREVLQNSYFKEVVAETSAAVSRGEQLSQSFGRHEDLYPPFVGEMMVVGEETGQTNEILKRLAMYYEEEVDRKTKDLSTIIEPVLMLLIGGAVGFFAVAMISPIYSLSQNI